MSYSYNGSFSYQMDNNGMNVTVDPERQYVPYTYRVETYVVPVVFALIFVVGALGNGTLVLVLLRHRNLRSIPNTYIFSLATGDLLVILTCVPFTSTLYTLESWPYGDVICKISEWAKEVSIGVSVFTLTALSGERYCAIVNPLRRHAAGAIGDKAFTLITALFIWFLAIFFATPAAVFSHVEVRHLDYNLTIMVCTPFPEEYGTMYIHGMVLFKFFAYYSLPLCIIACFYIMMARHLEASALNMPGENQGQLPQMRARKKVAKMVLAFVALFVMCFGPYHVFNLWFHFNPHSQDEYDDFWHAFRITAFCLSFINSCINPIAFYFISGTFRKYFNRYLFGCCTEPQRLDSRRATFCDTSTHMTHLHGSSRHRLSQMDSSFKIDHLKVGNT